MTKQRTSSMAYRDGEEPDEDDPLLAFEPAPQKFIDDMRVRRFENGKILAEDERPEEDEGLAEDEALQAGGPRARSL